MSGPNAMKAVEQKLSFAYQHSVGNQPRAILHGIMSGNSFMLSKFATNGTCITAFMTLDPALFKNLAFFLFSFLHIEQNSVTPLYTMTDI